jgi:hypothetical protein
MSIDAMRWAKAQKTESPTRKAVLMALADYADEHGRAWPSQVRIAADTEMSERTVRTAIGELIERGFLTRQTRFRPDGTRATDVLHLSMSEGNRKHLPVDGGHRKQLPVDSEPPANDDATTGKSRTSHRQIASKLPAAAADKPLEELPTEELPKNGSEATASGSPAKAEPPISLTDQLWIDGKLTLIECGMSQLVAGRAIGRWLADYTDAGRILWAITEAGRARTRDPIPYVVALLNGSKNSPRASPAGRRSGMLSVAAEDYGLLQ